MGDSQHDVTCPKRIAPSLEQEARALAWLPLPGDLAASLLLELFLLPCNLDHCVL